MAKFTLNAGKFHRKNKDGSVTITKPGDEVELTKVQAEAMSDIITPADTKHAPKHAEAAPTTGASRVGA